MKLGYKKLGDYIQLVDERNRNLEVETLLGVSIRKVLMPSIANTIGTDMSTYKIIRKNQFAYGTVTSRNGDKISIALLKDFDKTLISQIYLVFEIIDESLVLPDYLMMWFTRPEFDRYARFKSHGSARETFDWAEMLETELPIPSPEKQKELIEEYEAVENRIQLNKKLCATLEETAQTICKHWFEDFEFPDKSGKPYRSSGGEMVECDKLGKKIPKGWRVDSLIGIANYKNGLAMQKFPPKKFELGLPVLKIKELGMGNTDENSDRCTVEIPEEIKIFNGDIVFSWSGSLKIDLWTGGLAGLNQHLFKVTSKKFPKWFYYLWTKNHLDSFIKIADGNKTSMGHIKREHLESAIVLVPTKNQMDEMTKLMNVIFDKIINLKLQTQKLEDLKSLLLGKMAGEN